MSTTTVMTYTIEKARERRDELVQSLGGDETSLRERADAYVLDADELAGLDEIDDLDFLISHAHA